MKRVISLLLATTALSLSSGAINIKITPGYLAEHRSALSGTDLSTVTLSGEGNVRDLITLMEICEKTSVIDLSAMTLTSLKASRPVINGKTYFEAGEIPAYMFFEAKAPVILLPANTTVIGEGAFAASAIKDISIPEGVKEIAENAFYDCPELVSVSFPKSLTTIGKGAFGKAKSLKQIDLSSTSVTTLPDRCFAGCSSLSYIKLPSTISRLGEEVFFGTAVTTLSLPAVTTAADFALAGMSRLHTVSINKEASMGEGLLMNSTNLSLISGVPANVPALFVANCHNLDTDAILKHAASLDAFSLTGTKGDTLTFVPPLAYIGHGALSSLSELYAINASALKAVPLAEEDAFGDLDPTDVQLIVSPALADEWRSNPLWGKFNIIVDSASVGFEPEGADSITVVSDGISLIIRSSTTVSSVTIYGTDGSTLLSASPGSAQWTIGLEEIPANIFIVSACDGQTLKTAKILKN